MRSLVVEQFRDNHRRVYDYTVDLYVCGECSRGNFRNTAWPCDVAKLLMEYDRLARRVIELENTENQ